MTIDPITGIDLSGLDPIDPSLLEDDGKVQIPAGRTTLENPYDAMYGRHNALRRHNSMAQAGIDPLATTTSEQRGPGFLSRIKNFFSNLFSFGSRDNSRLAGNKEIFKGVTAKDLKNAGFSKEKISSIQTAIAKKKNNNPNLARHIGRYAEYNLTFTPQELGLSNEEAIRLNTVIQNGQGRV